MGGPRKKHTAAELAAKGRCSGCTRKLAEGCTFKTCDRCRTTKAKSAMAVYRASRRKHQCIDCHRRPRAQGRIDCEAPWISDQYTRCGDCREANSAKCKQRAAERIAAGVCRGCGKLPPVAGSTNCRKCRARRRARDRSE